ncbi:hypothetical protein ACFVAJ_17825 [Agromyces sp. NPDC057679]|uniref:hypothetical protein n=1 Tax=Agromyces sp. NPDC057679 TaxID=3346207 RepID=UPI003670A304
MPERQTVAEHVARLRGIWGDRDDQVRWHLYRAVHDDVRFHSEAWDPDREAHAAGLQAVWEAALLRGGTPEDISQPELPPLLAWDGLPPCECPGDGPESPDEDHENYCPRAETNSNEAADEPYDWKADARAATIEHLRASVAHRDV